MTTKCQAQWQAEQRNMRNDELKLVCRMRISIMLLHIPSQSHVGLVVCIFLFIRQQFLNKKLFL